MTQTIRNHLGLAPDPHEYNLQLAGFVPSGIISGMRCATGSVAASVTIGFGEWFSAQGDQIAEDAARADYFCAASGRPLTANATASARYDLIVGEYWYVAAPDKQAVYKIVLGTAGDDDIPDWSNVQFPIAIARMPAGASSYDSYWSFPRAWRWNCYVEAGLEYVRYGDQTAIKVMVVHEAIPVLDLVAGLHAQFVESGELSDGDEIIEWKTPFVLTPDGEVSIQAWIDEIIAARGNCSNLNDRLSVALDGDGNLKRVGLLDNVMDEVEAARGEQKDLDTRLDVSMDNYGFIQHPDLAGMAGPIGTPGLPWYIPDQRASCSDHDARYYPRTEIDATLASTIEDAEDEVADALRKLHMDGVLTGCDYDSDALVVGPSTVRVVYFTAGYVLYQGRVIQVDVSSVSIDSTYTGEKYISVTPTGSLSTAEGDYPTGVRIRKLYLTSGSIDQNLDTRKNIALPDRANDFRAADDLSETLSADESGGFSLVWQGKMAIGQMVDSGTDNVTINHVSTDNPFTEGMTVVIRDSGGTCYFRTVQTSSTSSPTIFLTGAGLPNGMTGAISEYRKLDTLRDYRDRLLTIIGSGDERNADSDSLLPGGNDDYQTFSGIVVFNGSLATSGNMTPFVGQLYSEDGIEWDATAWQAVSTSPASAQAFTIYVGSETATGDGWRLFAEKEYGHLLLTYSKYNWTSAKGGYVYFNMAIMCGPKINAYR